MRKKAATFGFFSQFFIITCVTAQNTFPASGSVGVGTTSPISRLHVAQGNIMLENVVNSSDCASVRGIKGRGTTNAKLPILADDFLIYIGGGGYTSASAYAQNRAMVGLKAAQNWSPTSSGSYITFETTPNGSTTRQRVMTVDQSGMVSIGTNTPTHPLTVNGAIRAKEIVVDAGWADYVFAPGYRLAPLAEVEAHIKEKGHLPDVPSAKEVGEKGVSIGESQALLLRKVEELTLHVIELNKTVQEQKNKIGALESLVRQDLK